jgi:RNA polymerase sigma-70 factor (ECF subfamily)
MVTEAATTRCEREQPNIFGGGRLHQDSETSERQLINRARAGDAGAFGQLVRTHAPVAKRMAVLWGAGVEADDVVQESFVKAHAALARFREEGNFRAWLLSIVHNETRNARRSRGRRAVRDEHAGFPVAELRFDPEAETLSAARREELLARVRALPPQLREVVASRYLLELSEAETVAVLAIPAGTVKSRLHRALAILREEVSHD